MTISPICRRAAALVLCIALTPTAARAEFVDDFAALLYEGRTGDAVELAAATGGTGKQQFAKGAAEFLLAVEHLGQGLHRFGLASSYNENPAASMGMLPVLRLPVPPNQNPEPVTYTGLRALLERFEADLDRAAETLTAVGPETFDLTLDLARIKLDFDGDGLASDNEALLYTVFAVAGPLQSSAGLQADFDQSDAPWLQGYCHLLSALTEFLLAHDWEEAFDTTFHALFPDSDLRASEMNANRQIPRIEERLQELANPDGRPLRFDQGDGDYDDWKNSDEGLRAAEANALLEIRGNLQYGFGDFQWLAGIADLIAFLHHFDWPVTEPERMGTARTDLLAMIALSRENWERILSETDDAREWVPGPAQSGLFENTRVEAEVVQGWKLFLDEFEDILEGRKLVPHWRIGYGGINVRRMFEEPRDFAPILIAQGSAVLPYIENGQMTGADTFVTILDLMDGGLLAYFVWFN